MASSKHRIFTEIERCSVSFKYFASRHIKIIDIDGVERRLETNEAQSRILEAFAESDNVMILKARKLGSTTLIAAYFLWKALFNKNTSIAVVAHTDDAAKAIFSIYQHMYAGLPAELKVPAEKNKNNELKLKTGSTIRVGTAASEGFRGQTYQFIHASEYAFWPSLDKSIAALFGTAGANAVIVLESTANGLNQAYEMWKNDNGYKKIFLGWMLDVRYTSDKQHHKDYSEMEREYHRKHGLTDEQLNWAVHHLRTKCGNNWATFNQEFPVSAEIAFVTSGQRFFPDPWKINNTTEGLKIFDEPQKFHIYSIGVDVASGSPGGDYSAFMVLDVTDSENVSMVASYYDRQPPSEYKEIVLEIAEKYQALAVVESNSYGLSIIEHLVEKSYPRQYRDQHWDKINNRWTPRVGFNTNAKSRALLLARLYEYVTRGWLNVSDENFMAEANTLVYNARGRVEAPSGKHDDMVMATGLALIGLDQVDELIQEVALSVRPSNIKEMLEWEAATGRSFKETRAEEFAPSPLDEVLATDVLGGSSVF